MHPENRFVPFPPEILNSKQGDLESYVAHSVSNQGLINASDLPTVFTSTNIEAYANWLGKLTQADPLRRERAGTIHVRAEDKKFIFPTNPYVGTENQAMVIESKKPMKFHPMVDIHTHPDSTAFSPTDISGAFSAPVQVVSTARYNYLYLHTEESDRKQGRYFELATKGLREDSVRLTQAARFRIMREAFEVLGRKDPQRVSPDEIKQMYACMIEEEIKMYGSDYERYKFTLTTGLTAAFAYNFGFYFSEKDGNYKKIDPEFLYDVDSKYADIGVNAWDRFKELKGK